MEMNTWKAVKVFREEKEQQASEKGSESLLPKILQPKTQSVFFKLQLYSNEEN